MFKYESNRTGVGVSVNGVPTYFVMPDVSIGILFQTSSDGAITLLARGRVARILERQKAERAGRHPASVQALFVRAEQLDRVALTIMNGVLAGILPDQALVNTFEILLSQEKDGLPLAARRDS